MKFLLILMAVSSVLGGIFWQEDDPELLHFQSCDQRLEFNYPTEFAVHENGTGGGPDTFAGMTDVYMRSLYLQYYPAQDEIDPLRPPFHLIIELDNTWLDSSFEEPMDWIERWLITEEGMDSVQELELAGFSGMVGYAPSEDSFLAILYLEDNFLLFFHATADDMVSLDTLAEMVNTIVQTLEFDTQNATDGDLVLAFTRDCALSLYYPDELGHTLYRGRYLFYSSEDAKYNYVSRQPVDAGDMVIEVMSHEQTLAYFELTKEDANGEDVLRSFMTVRDLLPYEAPQATSDDTERNLLTAHHAGGLVTVLEIDGELTIIALYTGGDIEDYAEEYWSMIDSIRLHGRGEDTEESVESAD